VAGHKSWKQTLAAGLPPITLARDPDGGVHELVKLADAQKALVALGVLKKEPARSSSSSSSSKSKAPPEPKKSPARQLAEKVSTAAAAAVVAQVERGSYDKAAMLLLAREVLEQIGSGAVEERRGLKRGELQKSLTKMTERQLSGVVVEAAIGFDTYGDQVEKRVVEACKAFGVDYKAIERKVKAEMPADLKAKPVKKGKKS